MFPFDKVMKGERIVLYGAGTVGQAYMDQLSQLDYCEVVLWVDKNFDKYEDGQIKSPDNIIKVAFDKIIIAIFSEQIRECAKEELVVLGIKKEKIF